MRTLLTTALVSLALLLCLLNLATTAGWTRSVPGGADAMGLVVPIFASIAAALALVAATWIAAGDGRLAWMAPLGGTVVRSLLLALGVGGAIVGTMIVWMTQTGGWVAPLGLLGGAVGPALMSAVLLTSRVVASGATDVAPLPRGFLIALLPIAGVGYALGLVGVGVWIRFDLQRSADLLAEVREQEDRRERDEAMSPAERMTERFAAFSVDAPAWTIVAALLEWGHDDDARAVIVARTLQVPNLDEELASTLTSEYPRYRTAALDFVRALDAAQLQPAWGAAVAASIDTTAAAIRGDASWLRDGEELPPGPLGNLRMLHAAAARYADQRTVQRALDDLRAAIAALPPESPHRDDAVAILTPRS